MIMTKQDAINTILANNICADIMEMDATCEVQCACYNVIKAEMDHFLGNGM
jgi:hypothetical protein